MEPTSKRAARPLSLRRLTRCAMLAAVLCLCSLISIPIGVIPVSLGLFGVLLAAVLLPPVDSAMAVLVYLLLGACGLPVFSGGGSGLAALTGPTGGYLWSYPLVALLVSLLVQLVGRRWSGASPRTALSIPCCVLGVALCYACGTAHYVLFAHVSVAHALGVCVVPFLPFDLLKCLFASFLGIRLRAALNRGA